ncbi:MAG: hypothetical protein IIB65_14115 [Proteobacteria bacterium]|nr:hypothetical protein [Pseudomonadota bacterium]MCH8095777.1 hypothetical protein [Pseudomonadota bacterium]
MNIHKNARLTPRGREILISRLERGEHPLDVATAMGASARSKSSENFISPIPCDRSVGLIQASFQEGRNKPDRSRVTYGGHIICT